MRATESMWYRDSLFSINRNKLEFAKTIQQQSSGKRINTFSDDPAGSSFVVGLNDRKAQITQFITNVDRTQTLLSNTETAISQIQNVLNSAVTTLSQATTGAGSSACSSASSCSQVCTAVCRLLAASMSWLR